MILNTVFILCNKNKKINLVVLGAGPAQLMISGKLKISFPCLVFKKPKTKNIFLFMSVFTEFFIWLNVMVTGPYNITT